MPRPFRTAAPAAFVLIAFAAATAQAKVASPQLCGVPTVVVGCPSGAAIASCSAAYGETMQQAEGFRVVLRDAANNPLGFTEVWLDFSATPVHLLGDDRPGTTVDCASRTIRRMTDAQGVALFAPRFCGGTEEARVRVIAEGVWVREIPARSTDLDGDGLTGLADFERVARNFLSGGHDGTTDFTPCSGDPGLTNLGDFAIFGGEFLRAQGGVACP